MIAKAGTASASTTNGGFASSGPRARTGRSTSRPPTITEEKEKGRGRKFGIAPPRCRATSTSRSTGSLASSTVRVRSPPTPRSGSATGSAPAQSSGSTCRSSTSCAGRMPTSAPRWKGCPRSGRFCARAARAPTRMRLRTFRRTSARVQPRKCTQPTIGPGQPPRKLDRAESTSESKRATLPQSRGGIG